MALPWAIGARRRVRRPAQLQRRARAVNINAVDFGAAFLPPNQDPTLAPARRRARPRCQTDLMRAFRGYSAITQQQSRGWRTYHSLQMSFNRRFSNGLSFGFNDTIGCCRQQAAPRARLQHNADGTYRPRRPGAGRRAARQQHPRRAHAEGRTSCGICPTCKQRRRGAARRSATSSTTGSCRASGPAATGTAYTVGSRLPERRRQQRRT